MMAGTSGPGFDAGLADGEFAPENFNQEVTVAASGLQETGVEALRLRLHKVEHRVHFAGIGEYLAVSRHPFLGLDLGVHSALSLGECDSSETEQKPPGTKNVDELVHIPGTWRKPFLRTSHVHAKTQTFTDLSGVGNLKTAKKTSINHQSIIIGAGAKVPDIQQIT